MKEEDAKSRPKRGRDKVEVRKEQLVEPLPYTENMPHHRLHTRQILDFCLFSPAKK